MLTVGQFIAKVCEQFPEHFLLSDFRQGCKYTYSRWADDSISLAGQLQEKGFAPGDFVMFRFGNDYGYLLAYGGVSRVEGVVAPIAVRLTKREVARLLAFVRPRWFLTDRAGWTELNQIIKQSSVSMAGVYDHGEWDWVKINPLLKARLPEPELAHLRFTSGSQGEPKAVALTHGNMLCRVGNTGLYALPGDIFYLPIPFVFRPDRVIQALSVGAEIVVDDSIYPNQIVRCWQESQVTFAWLVPTIIGLLIQLDRKDIPGNLSLRAINTGGAYLYRNWEERFERLFGVPVYQQYGLSEGCVAFENPVSKRIGSVGKPAPAVEARICDPQGYELVLGQTGELWYRGSNVMKGYLDRPDLTAAALRDGWLRTGDLARFDKDGYLFIEGRVKDLIHSSGLKFSPREVEEVLLLYPGIREVIVVPVSHLSKGEVGKAFYVADRVIRSGELREFCREMLADYKIPREWDQVESLPRLHSGKIARRSVGSG